MLVGRAGPLQRVRNARPARGRAREGAGREIGPGQAMKPARATRTSAIGDVVVVRPELAGVTVVRRVADPGRRRRVVRLVALLLDKPDRSGQP